MENSEIGIKTMIQKISFVANLIWLHKLKIFCAAIVGGLVGILVAVSTPVKYASKVVFVIEDSKSPVSGIAAIAGQFGIDIGSSSGGNIFAGENILLYLKSEELCREVLLTSYSEKGYYSLADKYAEVYELKEEWQENKKIGKVSFSNNRSGVFNRLQDSLIQVILTNIIENSLVVSKPDKKATYIEVKVEMRDEKLSDKFSKRLVEIATEKYVNNKLRIKLKNVQVLQKRADSLSAILNEKTSRLASMQQNLIDFNPALKSNLVGSEVVSRDKTLVMAIFGEVVKNLEISKTILNQETPVIQIIDQSRYPLKKIKKSKLYTSLEFSILFAFVISLFIVFKYWFSSILK